MKREAYGAAKTVATEVCGYFERHLSVAQSKGPDHLAALPSIEFAVLGWDKRRGQRQRSVPRQSSNLNVARRVHVWVLV